MGHRTLAVHVQELGQLNLLKYKLKSSFIIPSFSEFVTTKEIQFVVFIKHVCHRTTKQSAQDLGGNIFSKQFSTKAAALNKNKKRNMLITNGSVCLYSLSAIDEKSNSTLKLSMAVSANSMTNLVSGNNGAALALQQVLEHSSTLEVLVF